MSVAVEMKGQKLFATRLKVAKSDRDVDRFGELRLRPAGLHDSFDGRARVMERESSLILIANCRSAFSARRQAA